MKEAELFWGNVRLGAANLNLEVVVEPTGKMSLRHKKSFGDPERPSDDKVETFRNFLGRNREMILEANGVKPQVDAYAEDARRLKEWLAARKDAPDCVLKDRGGREWRFAETRDRLLRTYAEKPEWVLAAFRFQKVVNNHVGWSDANAEKMDCFK